MAMTSWPASESVLAMPSPSPRLPPVTMTLPIVPSKLTGWGYSQGGNEANRCRNLVSVQGASTGLENFRLGILSYRSIESFLGITGENNVGGDHGSRDWISARFDERHPYLWMSIDHCLDFLRM